MSICDLHEEVTQSPSGFQTPHPKTNEALLQILVFYHCDLTLDLQADDDVIIDAAVTNIKLQESKDKNTTIELLR